MASVLRREVPGRRADADRTLARDLLQHVGRAHLQVALRGLGQDRVALVDPAVDADLVAVGGDAALLVGMQHGRDRRHVEGRGDGVLLQQRQDARDAGAVAVLALAQAADRFAAFAQLAGLVVGVERDRHGATRTARPHVGPQRPAGAHALDDAAPALLGPLPGLLRLFLLGNDGRACRHGLLLLVFRHLSPVGRRVRERLRAQLPPRLLRRSRSMTFMRSDCRSPAAPGR